MARAKRQPKEKVEEKVEEKVVEEQVEEKVEEKPEPKKEEKPKQKKSSSFDKWWDEVGSVMMRNGHAARGIALVALSASGKGITFSELVNSNEEIKDLLKVNDAKGVAELAYNAK